VGVGGRGRGVVVAVKVEVGDLDLAPVLGLVGLLGPGDLEVGGTTALLVPDCVLSLAAVVGLLADGAVGHAVVELEAALELDLDVELLEGELVYAGEGTAREGGGRVNVGTAVTDNVLGAAIVFAGPAVEVETLVEVEPAGDEVLPVEAALPLVVTLVVAVTGAGELVGVVPLVTTETESSSGGADAGPDGQNGDKGLHFVGWKKRDGVLLPGNSCNSWSECYRQIMKILCIYINLVGSKIANDFDPENESMVLCKTNEEHTELDVRKKGTVLLRE
jgi:hypothetical protein